MFGFYPAPPVYYNPWEATYRPARFPAAEDACKCSSCNSRARNAGRAYSGTPFHTLAGLGPQCGHPAVLYPWCDGHAGPLEDDQEDDCDVQPEAHYFSQRQQGSRQRQQQYANSPIHSPHMQLPVPAYSTSLAHNAAPVTASYSKPSEMGRPTRHCKVGPGFVPCAAAVAAAIPAQHQRLGSQRQQEEEDYQQQLPTSPTPPASPHATGSKLTIPVQVVHPSTDPDSQQRQPVTVIVQQTGRAVSKSADKPAKAMSRSEAATIIQSMWRMKRLARQRPALDALAVAGSQLRAASLKFKSYKEPVAALSLSSTSTSSSSGSDSSSSPRYLITHKQYLELNELAMRVLLQLDATVCGVAELRTVRKRLTASAIKLLDEIQAAYSAAVTASMDVSNGAEQSIEAAAASKATAQGQQSAVASRCAEKQYQEQQEEQQEEQSTLASRRQEEQQQEQQQQDQQQSLQWKQQYNVGNHAILMEGAGQKMCGRPSGSEDLHRGHATDGGQQEDFSINDDDGQAERGGEAEGCALPTQLPAGVRVVLVYPGSRCDAATQTAPS